MSKENTILLATTLVPQVFAAVYFNSIKSEAGCLFDLKKTAPGFDEEMEERIKFLKELPLEDMKIQKYKDSDFLEIVNNKTNQAILVSNRATPNKEFRSDILREYLKDEAGIHPKQTAYDAIMKRIRDPKMSSEFAAIKDTLVIRTDEQNFEEDIDAGKMTETHLNLYAQILLEAISQNIKVKDIPVDDYTPEKVTSDEGFRKELLEGIDAQTLFEVTENYAPGIGMIDVQIKKFYTDSDVENEKLAKKLKSDIVSLISQLAHGTISFNDFKEEYQNTIDMLPTESNWEKTYKNLVEDITTLSKNAAIVDTVLEKPIIAMNQQIEALQANVALYTKKGDEKKISLYTNALDAAEKLKSSLDGAVKKLRGGKIHTVGFKEECNRALNVARPVLETHRGWKGIFADVANAILKWVGSDKRVLPTKSALMMNAVKAKLDSIKVIASQDQQEPEPERDTASKPLK